MVYATCSLFRSENEDQIERFLTDYPNYRVVDIYENWPFSTSCPVSGAYLRLNPKDHGTDGFFAAVLERIE